MRYDLIEIKPNCYNKTKKWEVFFQQDDTDREPGTGADFRNLGFYRFPRTHSIKAGFEHLRGYLIERHENEIMRLNESLSALRALNCPDFQRTKVLKKHEKK